MTQIRRNALNCINDDEYDLKESVLLIYISIFGQYNIVAFHDGKKPLFLQYPVPFISTCSFFTVTDLFMKNANNCVEETILT